MKRVVILSSTVLTVLCCLAGCDSRLGGDVEDNQRATTQNEIVKQDMESYIDPSRSVYK